MNRTINESLVLSQHQYARNLLEKKYLEILKPVHTPMDTKNDLYEEAEVFEDPTRYREIIGGLQYLLTTRPDIGFPFNKLSKFMQALLVVH